MAASVAEPAVSTDDMEEMSPGAATRGETEEPEQLVILGRVEESAEEDPHSDGDMENMHTCTEKAESVAVVVPAPTRPWEYQKLRDNSIVDCVVDEVPQLKGTPLYHVLYEGGREEDVSRYFLIFSLASRAFFPSAKISRV
jgi:hypothetical protein